MATLTGQLRTKVCSLGTGATFTAPGVRRNFFPGVKATNLNSGISYLIRQGHVERTSELDSNGYRKYKVINDVTTINKSFKTSEVGSKGAAALRAYKDQLKTRPLIDVLVSVENQMKVMNGRLGDALTQASSSTQTKDLESYTIPELLAEISRRHSISP